MYSAKDYTKLIGMEGFSETLLNNHFTLYQGYVANTNKLLDTFGQLKDDCRRPNSASFTAGWDGNSTACACTNTTSKTSAARRRRQGRQACEETGRGLRQPGSVGERLQGHRRHEGHRLGSPLPGHASGKLINFWINEHDQGHPSSCKLILIMDVFEHAFMIDYGTKKAGYIDAFFKNVNWQAAEARMK